MKIRPYLLLPLLLALLLALLSSNLFSADTPDVELDVRWFGQTRDEVWGEDYLGSSSTITLHNHGCALTAAAMVLDYYNISIDPGSLNKWLLENNGFEDGWDDENGDYLGKVRLLWNIPVEEMEGIAAYKRYDYQDREADTDLIRSYLDRKIPLIAEVLRPGGIPHFVVIYGYEKDKFLIRDPLDENTRLLSDQYKISDSFGSGPERNIFGLRIYEPEAPED